ncbi:MAG: biopolymer transporter ExbD [Pseudomonadota bacterium]
MIKSRRRKVTREPTIGLINIVFLILIFFMVSGTLSKAPDSSVEYVTSEDLECCAPADALVITQRGELIYNKERFSNASSFMRDRNGRTGVLRVLPDKRLPANVLLQIVEQLRASGAKEIKLVVEQL